MTPIERVEKWAKDWGIYMEQDEAQFEQLVQMIVVAVAAGRTVLNNRIAHLETQRHGLLERIEKEGVMVRQAGKDAMSAVMSRDRAHEKIEELLVKLNDERRRVAEVENENKNLHATTRDTWQDVLYLVGVLDKTLQVIAPFHKRDVCGCDNCEMREKVEYTLRQFEGPSPDEDGPHE